MDPAYPTRPGEDVSNVPLSKAPDPCATERAALNWIDNALIYQNFVARDNPSRENSCAITKLEEAQMWAKKDLENKLNQPKEVS